MVPPAAVPPLWVFQQLEGSGPAGLGAPGHQQGLHKLVCVGAAWLMSLRLSVMLVQASVGRAVSRWSNLVDELEMLQILNFPSSWRNQVSGSCGRGGQNDD